MSKIFKKTKLFYTFLCLSLIYLFYLKQIYIYELNLDDLFYLSFGYPSDPIYLPLISNFFELISNNNLSFPYLFLYLPEALINKLFGFEYIWITLLIYKSLFIIIFLVGVNKIYNLKDFYFLCLGLLIVFLSLSNYELFSDRLMRPLLSNIFYLWIFLTFFKVIRYQESNLKDFAVLGGCSAICLTIVPWDTLFLFPFFLIFFKFLSKKKALVFLIFFIIFYISNLINYYNVFNTETLHLEYLGKKEINDNYAFTKDVLKEIFFSKRILFGLFFLISLSIFLKKSIYIFIMFGSLISGLIPYLILNTTVQTYHIPWGFFTFLFFLNFFVFLEVYHKHEKQIHKLFEVRLKLFFLIIIISLISTFFIQNNSFFYTGNGWIEKSKIIKNKYSRIFLRVENYPKEKTIITNDAYLRAYIMLKNRKLLPSEGFFSFDKIENKVIEVKKILSMKKKLTNIEYEICLNFISNTQNLFDSTSATQSKIIYYDKEELKNIRPISSWKLLIPNSIIEEISQYVNSSSGHNKNFVFLDLYKYSNSNGHTKCSYYKN